MDSGLGLVAPEAWYWRPAPTTLPGIPRELLWTVEERLTQKERQKLLLLFGGENLFKIPCRASYFSLEAFYEKDEFIILFQIMLMQFILFFKSSSAKQLARQGIE